MTELQDQTRQDQTQSRNSAVLTAPAGRRKAGNGLASLLLPELQSLASQLGISSTKLRKADLINAINAAQAPARPRVAAGTAAPADVVADGAVESSPPSRSRANGHSRRVNGAATANGASAPQPTSEAPAAGQSAPEQRAAVQTAPQQTESVQTAPEQTAPQQTAGRHNGAQPSTAESADSTQRPERGGNTSRNDGRPRRGEARETEARAQSDASTEQREPRNQGDQRSGEARVQNNRAQNNRNQNDRNQNDRNQNDRSQNDRNQNDRSQNDRSQNDRSQNDRTPQNDRGQNNTRTFEDDDEERGGRRGRRYRDRRGRSRTVGSTGSAPGDVEPTVRDDDVLLPVAGILDCVEEKNTWFVRTSGYFATSDDVYVANSFIRRFNLRRGDAVTGAIRQVPADKREKFNPLVRMDTVNGLDPESLRNRVEFTKLTPLYPQDRLRLETDSHILTTRVIDLVMPIGKGQRALIASPPKAGKTMVLQSIANAIATNNPEVHLMVVLIDERPEEVTDMQRSVKGEVIASTFDRHPRDHTTVAELSIERAKRLVEMGHDVVVLLDSITRLGRAYNLAAPASGRILSGGVDSTALYPPKRFLGAARNIENGGSLTILATALVETGSAGDSVIFEEFKGTGNAELKLDRKIADKRIFPAIDVDQSSTRKEEILLSPDELAVTIKLRRVLHALDPQQAIELLLDRLRKTRNNVEFLMQIAKTTPGD